MQKNFANLCVLILIVLPVCGCRDGLPDVGGTVTVDGQVITQGDVTFHPNDGGRSGSGRVKSDGKYLISYRKIGDGMPPGEYKVTIVADEFTPSNPPADEAEFDGAVIQQRGKLKHIVPAVYNRKETTPLSCTITEGGSYSEYDFELNTKKPSKKR